MKRHILSVLLVVCLTVSGVLGAEAPRKGTDANLYGHVVDVKPTNIFPMPR